MIYREGHPRGYPSERVIRLLRATWEHVHDPRDRDPDAWHRVYLKVVGEYLDICYGEPT